MTKALRPTIKTGRIPVFTRLYAKDEGYYSNDSCLGRLIGLFGVIAALCSCFYALAIYFD
jgi:predicted anti-sigma-YlaC factor YlaD